jgi:hypothetical protein
MINLHIIGDSHARVNTWGNIRVEGLNIICHYIEGKTCASFGIERPFIAEIKKEDWVCFCFGWIDCWYHLRKDHSIYKDITNKIVENYFYALSQYNYEKIFIFNVLPPVNPGTNIKEDKREYVREYFTYMNDCLREKCAKFGYIFFDVYKDYVSGEGYFDERFKDSCVHIKDTKFLVEFLNNYIKNTA